MAVVTRQPGGLGRDRGAQPVHPQPAQQGPDLFIGDTDVDEHHQEVVQQCLPVPAGLRPLRQRLDHLLLGV